MDVGRGPARGPACSARAAASPLACLPLDHGTPALIPLPCSWARACQTIFLRHRTSTIKRSLLGDASPLDAVVYGAPFGLVGPQARVKFVSTPATRFRPAASEVTAEVGQMLAYVRIKQQASMAAFATQLSQITDALGGPAKGGAAAAEAAPPAQPPSPTAQLPKLQTGLKVGGQGGLAWADAGRACSHTVQARALHLPHTTTALHTSHPFTGVHHCGGHRCAVPGAVARPDEREAGAGAGDCGPAHRHAPVRWAGHAPKGTA